MNWGTTLGSSTAAPWVLGMQNPLSHSAASRPALPLHHACGSEPCGSTESSAPCQAVIPALTAPAGAGQRDPVGSLACQPSPHARGRGCPGVVGAGEPGALWSLGWHGEIASHLVSSKGLVSSLPSSSGQNGRYVHLQGPQSRTDPEVARVSAEQPSWKASHLAHLPCVAQRNTCGTEGCLEQFLGCLKRWVLAALDLGFGVARFSGWK